MSHAVGVECKKKKRSFQQQKLRFGLYSIDASVTLNLPTGNDTLGEKLAVD